MYCDFHIPLIYRGRDVTMVVTEVEYTPEQKSDYTQEFLPEGVEIQSGYVLGDDGREIDFNGVFSELDMFVSARLLSLYKEA